MMTLTSTTAKSKTDNVLPDLPDFVAIDFEAANSATTSVCSVGIVIVRNREIVEEFYSLVKPVPNHYDFYTSKIHGLKKKDTDNAPVFPQVWNQIEKKLKGLPFVAHGFEFEKRCLNSLFEYYHMGRKRFKIYDTKRASEIVFPDLENHKLQTVAVECGYDFTKQKKHHNALADAEACATIAMTTFSSL